MIRRILFAVLVAFATLLQHAAEAATQAQLDSARARAVAWLIAQQASDGRWHSAPRLDVQTTSAVLQGFEALGIAHGYPRSAALSWTANAEPASVEGLARQLLIMARAGMVTTTQQASLIGARASTFISADGMSAGVRFGWDAYPGFQASVPDTAMALDAFVFGNLSYAERNATLAYLAYTRASFGTRNGDGGWPYQGLETFSSTAYVPMSNVIPTAYAVLSLARGRIALGGADFGDNGINNAITAGVGWLVARARSDGGYSDDPDVTIGSPFETALVLQALRKAKESNNAAAVAATATIANAIDFLIAEQAGDGNWEADALATATALSGLPGNVSTLADSALADVDGDGVPDAAEALLDTDPNVVDARYLAGSSSRTEPGTHDAAALAPGALDTVYSGQLLHTNGTPTGYARISGQLPPGITFNPTTGALTGMPTATGAYNFQYRVTYADGSSEVLIASISIPEPESHQVTTASAGRAKSRTRVATIACSSTTATATSLPSWCSRKAWARRPIPPPIRRRRPICWPTPVTPT